ncbi:MAG: hypothetical protein GTN69_05785 [Armatimonadetes bacterium]|nr:hypothetical protein [Armatimonadota bacterium]
MQIDPESQGQEGKIFWTGRTVGVRLIGLAACFFAVGIPFAFAFEYLQKEYVGTTAISRAATMLGVLILTVVSVWLARWAFLQRRNACVIVQENGLVRQNWQRHGLFIPWDAVKELVLTEIESGTELAIKYLDDQGTLRKALLLTDSVYAGPKSTDALSKSILQYKTLPRESQRITWYLGREYIWME